MLADDFVHSVLKIGYECELIKVIRGTDGGGGSALSESAAKLDHMMKKEIQDWGIHHYELR